MLNHHRNAVVGVALWMACVGATNAADGVFGSFDSPASGAARSWQGSYPVTPWSTFNLYNGNTLTQTTLLSFDPVGPSIDFTLYHNSADATDGKSAEDGQGFDLGDGWSTTYSGRITLNGAETIATVIEDDGTRNKFTLSSGDWDPPTGNFDTLVEQAGGGWHLTRLDQSLRVFNADGLLTAVKDSSGNQVTLVRDPNNDDRITRIRSAVHGLDENGYLADPNDPNPIVHQLSFVYGDPANLDRLTKVKDAIGREWEFQYNQNNGKLIYIHYPTDSSVPASKMRFVYYVTNGRIKQVYARYRAAEDPLIWTYSYTGEVLTQVDDPEQNVDPNNIVSQGLSSAVLIDPFTSGLILRRTLTDKRGKVWAWEYDPTDGLLELTRDPLSNEQQFEYDSDRNVTKFTNEFGKEWTMTYGAVGNLLTLTTPITGQTWTYAWEQPDPTNKPRFYRRTKITDPAGHWTEFEYADSTSDPNEPDDPTKVVRIIEQEAETGSGTTTTHLRYYTTKPWNSFSQLRRVIDANASITQFEYDKWGYLETTTGGLTDTHWLFRDIPESVLPTSISSTNDAAGRSTGATGDAGGGSGSLDVDDQPTSTICVLEADGLLPQTNHPIPGKAQRLGTEPIGLDIYTHDTLGRPTGIDREPPDLVSGAFGRLFDTERRTDFAYDGFGRLATMTSISGDPNDPNRIQRTFVYDDYDEDGRLLEQTGPDGQMSSFAYDNLGRLKSADRDSLGADFFYFKDSSLKRIEYANGTEQTRTYDDARRLKTVTFSDPTDVATLALEYDWSLDNQVNKRTETVGSDVWEVVFEYDNRDRLTRETRTKTSDDPASVEYDVEYGYDALGNRTTKTEHVIERRTDYSYDVDFDPNQLTKFTRDNRLLSYSVFDTSGASDVLLRTVRYTYYKTGWVSNIAIKDENGPAGDPNATNWVQDLAMFYYADGQLRLAQLGKYKLDPNDNPRPSTYEPLSAKEFRYDSARSRYLTVSYDTNGSQNRADWDFDGPVNWTDYEDDSPYGDASLDDTQGQQFALTEATGYLGLGAQVDVTSGSESYFQGDLIGSTFATSNASGGTSVGAVSYTAFGEPIGDFAGMPRYQYAGQWGYEAGLIELPGVSPDLPALKLQHLGWRWYQAELGRFVQRDPIGIFGGQNVYFYANGNPLIFIDPLGLRSWSGWFLDWTGGRRHVPVLDPGPHQDAVQTTAVVVSCAAPVGAGARIITMGGKGVRAAQSSPLLKPLLKIRQYIRLDRPHHGKGWHLDGKWFGGR